MKKLLPIILGVLLMLVISGNILAYTTEEQAVLDGFMNNAGISAAQKENYILINRTASAANMGQFSIDPKIAVIKVNTAYTYKLVPEGGVNNFFQLKAYTSTGTETSLSYYSPTESATAYAFTLAKNYTTNMNAGIQAYFITSTSNVYLEDGTTLFFPLPEPEKPKLVPGVEAIQGLLPQILQTGSVILPVALVGLALLLVVPLAKRLFPSWNR